MLTRQSGHAVAQLYHISLSNGTGGGWQLEAECGHDRVRSGHLRARAPVRLEQEYTGDPDLTTVPFPARQGEGRTDGGDDTNIDAQDAQDTQDARDIGIPETPSCLCRPSMFSPGPCPAFQDLP